MVLTEIRETTGAVSALRVTADRSNISADGEDVAVFMVEAIDDMGRAVPTANDLIQFKLEGDCVLLGVGNGDPNSHEPDKDPRRSLFMGLAQVIVQSGKTPGDIILEAYTEAFPGPRLPLVKAKVTMNRSKTRPSV